MPYARFLRVALGGALVVMPALAGCDEGPFAVEVVSFEPGAGAGFGQEAMPDIVLGPPAGAGRTQGSMDVVSLGAGGRIVLRLGRTIVDGEGPDLLVFENPFETPTGVVFAEPGEIAVSDDGERFTIFPCQPDAPAPNGCAGYRFVVADANDEVAATDPDLAGGDAFDLGAVGVSQARYVRISDRGTSTAAPFAGFDLDAVACVGD